MWSEGGGRRRLSHAEAQSIGAAARRQKQQLMLELETRTRELARVRAEAGDARRLVESAEASRSWRLGHRLMRAGRALTGRGRERGSALTAAAEQLADIEAMGEDLLERTGRKPGYLFVSGCARSGTSATVELLNSDPRMAIGMERFKYLQGRIRPYHFRPGYFLNPSPDETNVLHGGTYRELRRKWEDGEVRLVGDKVLAQRRARVYAQLMHHFSRPKLVFLLRDPEAVAGSYERRLANPRDINWPHDHRRAIDDWNLSIAALRELAEDDPEAEFFVLRYERLFSGDVEYLRQLFAYLELEPSPEVEIALAGMTSDWPEREARGDQLSDDQRAFVREHADRRLAEWIARQPGAAERV